MPIDPVNSGVPANTTVAPVKEKNDDANPERSTSFSSTGSENGVNAGLGALAENAEKLSALFRIARSSVTVATQAARNEQISFDKYLEKVSENPKLIRLSAQRAYDMILSKGRNAIEVDGEPIYEYEFFRHTVDPRDSISGVKKAIHLFVEAIGGAAKETGPDQRIILLAGPVGSAKTTLARGLFRGLEEYSATEEGEMHALGWNLRDEKGELLKDKKGQLLFKYVDPDKSCEIFEDPLNVIPLGSRKQIIEVLNAQRLNDARNAGIPIDYLLGTHSQLCPSCQNIFNKLVEHHDGDMDKVLSHVVAKRLILNEKTRTGITFFGAKDEKSHNANELSGSVNVRKLLQIGTDSDPQAITLDGDVLKANRGGVHFGEFIKLPNEIRYPLLDGAQDRAVKVARNAMVDFDSLLIATTNMPDWRKIARDEHQEAIRSRILPVTVPYLDRIQDEMGIYQKTFSAKAKQLGIHEAPHSLWLASLWALTTRLAEPKGANVTHIQKAYLYSGKRIAGFTEQEVTQMKRDVSPEEMELLKGVSPRDIQDALASALEHPVVTDREKGTRCVDPFIVVDTLKSRLKQLVAKITPEDKKAWSTRLEEVEKELDRKLSDDVRKAVSGDSKEVKNLFDNYIMHVKAWVKKEKVKDPLQGNKLVDPNEKLMKSIEEKRGINDTRRQDFRRGLIEQVGMMSIEGKVFDYDTDEQLKQSIEEALLEKHRDVTLPVMSVEFANEEQRRKLDTVKTRLIEEHGYCQHCAQIAMRRTQAPENRGR
ncbi:MAG: hypothetical protein HY094_08605 [Candidatus Melainabacteria bacterium]|nr:hypothetical protein [Candidatus Melainabacteria bacterium]